MPISISFKLYALKRRKNTDGEVPIYLRMTKNGKYRLLSTGISVEEKYWNKSAQTIRKSHPRNRVLNSQLKKLLDGAEDRISELPPDQQTLNRAKELLTQDDNLNLFKYAEEFSKKIKREGNLFESRQTMVLMRQLSDFFKTKNIEFGDLTLKKINEFREYLRLVKENNPNTINKKMKRLKRIFKNAALEEVISIDPFRNYTPLPSNKVEKTRLSTEQIKSISDLDLKTGSLKWNVQNAFLFSYYNAGIRFGDLCQLKWKNIIDGRLVYRMGKTGNIKNILLTPPALEILDLHKNSNQSEKDFIFNFLDNNVDYSDEIFLKRQISSKNALTNKVLKRIASLAGIEANVTFHVARHSFADYARKSEMSLYDISKALGHSDISITESYLSSFDEQSLDKSMSKLFGHNNKK